MRLRAHEAGASCGVSRDHSEAGVQMKKPGLAFALLAGLLCLDPEEEESASHGGKLRPSRRAVCVLFRTRGGLPTTGAQRGMHGGKRRRFSELVQARGLNYRTMRP